MRQGIKYASQRLDTFAFEKWLNKQLSKLWPFVAEVHTLAFCSGVLDSLAVELKALSMF
ncbi:hypothetical protein F383_21291 [Gossypium arboreum]|uniref:Uncharacterized protein n=1 Tax=Gossypium arboreum TaxID=29729 RepID=A0A0B0NUR4_GOSAR|nr:hypothetical protein F383_21291 [Gossypium arboreum]